MPRYTDVDKAINALWEHATKVLESTDFDPFTSDFYKMACRHSVEVLEAMPTIDVVERKHGKWIYPYETTMMVSICSECGSHGRGSNFCPNCGASMRKETEDE